MKKKIAMFFMAFMLFVLGVFVSFACDKTNDDDAKVTGITVELATDKYELVDDTITVVYGGKVELKHNDFKVVATLDNGNTKEILKKTADTDGYSFQSSIPQSYDVTPANTYSIVFIYGELEPFVIYVKVDRADFVGALNWNYSEPFVYNGEEQQVEIVDLPKGVIVEYTGVRQAINVDEYSCTANFTCTASSNYKSIPSTTLNWSISPAEVSVANIVLEEKTYTGTTQSVVISSESISALDNKLDKDNYIITGQTSGIDAGDYDVTITFSVLEQYANNYFVEPVTATWTIAKAVYANVGSVSFVGEHNFIYDGQAKTIVLDTTQLDENVSVVGTPTNLTATVAGDYTVEVCLGYTGSNDNYLDNAQTITLEWTIAKAPLAITAKDNSTTYGDDVVEAGVDFAGFVNGEDQSVLKDIQINYEYKNNGGDSYTVGSDSGEYVIDISSSIVSADNYEITFEEGVLTVDKRAITLAPNDITIEYQGVLEYAGVKLVAGEWATGDSLEVLGGSPEFDCSYAVGSVVGNYPISVSGYTSDNYDIAYDLGTLTVIKQTINVAGVALVDNKFVYSGEEPSLIIDETTIPNGVVAVVEKNNKNNVVAKNVGEYYAVIALSCVDDVNYKCSVDTVELKWAIIKADVDVSAYGLKEKSFEYNGQIKSVQFTELPRGAEVRSITGNSGKDVNLYTCTVVIGCSDSLNYNDFSITKNLQWNITPKTLTITANDYSVEYGSAVENTGVTYNGFVEGEDEKVLNGNISYLYRTSSNDVYSAGSNVGVYVIDIQNSTITNNNYDILFINGTLEVYAVEVDLAGYEEEWTSEVIRGYDATTPFMPEIINLPEGVRAIYTYTVNDISATQVDEPIEIGSYTATAVLVAYDDNYVLKNNNGVAGLGFEIVKKQIEAHKLIWTTEDGTVYEYSGSNIRPTYANSIVGLDITYTYYKENDSLEYEKLEDNAEITEIGKYKVVATLECVDVAHYEIVTYPEKTEIYYSIEKISVSAKALNWNIPTIFAREDDSGLYYLSDMSYTGVEEDVVLNGNRYLLVEYWNGSEYTTTPPTIMLKGEYNFIARITIADEYVDTHKLSTGGEEYLYYLTVVVDDIVFTSFKINGQDYELDEGVYSIHKYITLNSTLNYTIRSSYAMIYFQRDNNVNAWVTVPNEFVFSDYYFNEQNEYEFFVIDRAVNPSLDIWASENGVVNEITFYTYVVKNIVYGRDSDKIDYPYGGNVDYELNYGEDEFSIAFDDETRQIMSNYTFAYWLIDNEGNWSDNFVFDSSPLTFRNLKSIYCIMIILSIDGGESYYSLAQFRIIQPTVIGGYAITYIDFTSMEEEIDTCSKGATSYSINNGLVVNFEVVLKQEYEDAGLRIEYFADEEYTVPADYTQLGVQYIIFFVIYDSNGDVLEEGAFLIHYAFITNNTHLCMNALDYYEEYRTLYTVAISTQQFTPEYDVLEGNGIEISQTFNGEDSIILQDGEQIINYVLTIVYKGITYTFNYPINVICSLDITGCYSYEDVIQNNIYATYTYIDEDSNNETTIRYKIEKDSGTQINYIDLRNQYNVVNIADFASIANQLEFLIEDKYEVVSRWFVNVYGKFYIKLQIEEKQAAVSELETGDESSLCDIGYESPTYYYIELKVAGKYDSDTSAIINVYVTDGFGEDYTVNETEFEISAPAVSELNVSLNNHYANAEIYYINEDDSLVIIATREADKSYLKYRFTEGGEYYLRITATDGKTVTIYKIIVAEYIPLLEFDIAGNTYTLTMDENSDFIISQNNLELYIGAQQPVPSVIEIINFKSLIMSTASLYKDEECLQEITDFIDGFELVIDNSNEFVPQAKFYTKQAETVYTITIYLSEIDAPNKVLEVAYTDDTMEQIKFTVTQEADYTLVSDKFVIEQFGEYNENSRFTAEMQLDYFAVPASITLDSVMCAYPNGVLTDNNNAEATFDSWENVTLKVVSDNGYDYVSFNIALVVDERDISVDVILYLMTSPDQEQITQ